MKLRLLGRNTNKLIIESLKAEIYDKDREIKKLKEQLQNGTQINNKIRKLPTKTKKELGII